MDPALRRYIHESVLDRAAIQHIQSQLPDDVELDRWLEQAAADYAGDEMLCLVIAALGAGRRIDARHLIKGAAALAAGDILCEIAMKMTGDVPGYLMQAVRDSFISNRGKAYALAVAAVMYRDRGEEIPPSLNSMARTLADFDDLESNALPVLLGLAMFLQDDEVKSSLRRKHYTRETEASWRMKCEGTRTTFADFIRNRGATPVNEILPEKGVRQLAIGSTTIRRSVPRVGRNEPCHCGSGKKYKHCCFEKDRERLRRSSDIEGVTREESQEMPDEYLTADRLQRMTVTEVCALDPLRIPYDLLEQYFTRLSEWKEFDRGAEALEKIGYWAVDEPVWESLIFLSAFYGRKGAVARLLELRKKAMAECNIPDMRLDATYQLLPIEDDPVKSWEWIDAQALSVLDSEDVDDLRQFALAVLLTKHRALGILLCRGLIPLLSPDEFSSIVDYVLAARNELSLDPKDPITDITARLSAASDEALETDNALSEAQELLRLKTREARDAKEARDRALRDARRNEQELARRSAVEAGKARTPEDGDVLRELRRKAQNYEQTLREKNAEINALEHDVHEKQLEVETLRNRAGSESRQAAADSDAAEEELLLPPESQNANDRQPVRVIDFPRNFDQRLNAVPRNVARGALVALGRLAGGDPKAFENAVRLKACPSVTRVRIGIDHRLLFRLLPDRLQVVDLILRSELERKVKILATMYD
jgi:SEC-C motif